VFPNSPAMVKQSYTSDFKMDKIQFMYTVESRYHEVDGTIFCKFKLPEFAPRVNLTCKSSKRRIMV